MAKPDVGRLEVGLPADSWFNSFSRGVRGGEFFHAFLPGRDSGRARHGSDPRRTRSRNHRFSRGLADPVRAGLRCVRAGLVRVSGITVIDQEDPEQAYETARQAAVDAGDTSWPTWGFLPLEQKMQYIGL